MGANFLLNSVIFKVSAVSAAAGGAQDHPRVWGHFPHCSGATEREAGGDIPHKNTHYFNWNCQNLLLKLVKTRKEFCFENIEGKRICMYEK